ncbi:MAG: hypothetical protein KAV87_52110 [Desulfobacteraceae bacterium]|nr:hypothetical protein [Desulfobacteraceae bacterium]
MDNYYILVLFNIKGAGLGNNTDSDWLDYRLEIFQRYTLRSLANQNDGIFRVWMTCLEESEDILTPKIEVTKKKNPMMAIVDFIFDEQAACDRLTDNKESIYFLKLDSDDMYHRNTIKKTKQILSPYIAILDDIPIVMFCDGYIYDIRTKKMATFTQWSPPNIAVKYPPGTFDRKSFQKHCICNLTKVRARFNPIIINDRMVCCLDHDANLHSDPRRKGIELGKRTGTDGEIQQDEISEILRGFGVQQ